MTTVCTLQTPADCPSFCNSTSVSNTHFAEIVVVNRFQKLTLILLHLFMELFGKDFAHWSFEVQKLLWYIDKCFDILYSRGGSHLEHWQN